MPIEIFQSGANLDTRSEEEKKKDFKFEETVATANIVTWMEKPQNEWRHFPISSQNGSGSCVAQTMAKILGINYWLKNNTFIQFSATHIYQRRNNKPASGMNGVDAFEIARKGVTLEELVPSQEMTDETMDNTFIPQYKQDVGSIFKVPNYIQPPIKDIDTIASIIQTTGKGVMVWFYWQTDEWGNIPTINNPNLNLSLANRHSVTAVDFTLYRNKKALIIDDSWGLGYALNGQRVITEDFFKERNWFAAYPMNFVFDELINKPKHTFNSVLIFGQTNDDIRILQDILKYFGFFPSNISSTGVFLQITANALYKWQVENQVDTVDNLNALQGRSFGPKSIAKMNALLQ